MTGGADSRSIECLLHQFLIAKTLCLFYVETCNTKSFAQTGGQQNAGFPQAFDPVKLLTAQAFT